jgi:hypothetical protein
VVGQPVPVTAVGSTTGGTLNLYYNNVLVAGPVSGSATISGNPLWLLPGNQKIVAELVLAGISYYDTIQFYLPPGNTVLDLPPGVKKGSTIGRVVIL